MKNTVTFGRCVAAMAVICTLLTIFSLALIFADRSQSSITRRVHSFQKENGVLTRVVDPWRPLPGCLFLQSDQGKVLWPLDGGNNVNQSMTRLCGSSLSVLPVGAVSAGLNPLLLAANNRWRAPLQRSEFLPMNQVEQDGMLIPQGAHVELTLNAQRQTIAQSMVECMTGHADACVVAGLPKDTWAQNAEGAAARMFGVVIVDVESGAIEVLASAHSACYEAEHAGKPLPDDCPTPALQREHPLPGKLDHHAFSDAKPGSLVKPIMAVAFMRDPLLGPRLHARYGAARKSLLEDFKNSDSPDFLDRAFCRESSFNNCARLQRIAAAASDLGWNTSEGDLLALAENPSNDQTMRLMTPRFMQTVNQQGKWDAAPLGYRADQAKRCAIDKRWRKCSGEIANVASELMGEGNALASPLTIADMLRKIAGAANGDRAQAPTHLLQSVHGQVGGEFKYLFPDLKAAPLRINKQEAGLVLDGMLLTHQGGTATSGCLKAFGSLDNVASAPDACRRLTGVAGKTGTPGFADEAYTWDRRTQVCRDLQQKLNDHELPLRERRPFAMQMARCAQSPIKWYAAVLRDNPGSDRGPWTKVMVVLAERNYRRDGWIDSKGDVGSPNVAAELGFRLIKNL